MKKNDLLLITGLVAAWIMYFMRKEIASVTINAIEQTKAIAAGLSLSLIEAMATAIQDWEDGVRDGQLTRGTIAGDNNNPGNLRWFGNLNSIPFAGSLGVDQFNHIVFETPEAGWNGLIKQLRLAFTGQSSNYNPGMNLYQFFAKYAEANTGNYANFVASAIGVDPNSTLSEIKASWQ
jgi:hypothetical protein